jgi:hypothetical protein
MNELQLLEQQITDFKIEADHIMTAYEADIALEHNMLDDCLKNQITLQLEFERLLARAKGLEQDADSLKEQYHSYAFSVEMKSNKRPDSITEAKMHADCNTDYIRAVKAYNSIYKTRLEIAAVTEVLTTRKYTLTNITNAVIEGVNKHLL